MPKTNLIETISDLAEKRISRRTALRGGITSSLSLILACGVQKAGESLPKPSGNPVIKEPGPRPVQKPQFRPGDQMPTEPGESGKPFLRTG